MLLGKGEHVVKCCEKIGVREGGCIATEQGMSLGQPGRYVGHDVVLARDVHRGEAPGVIPMEHERQATEEPTCGRRQGF